PPTRSTLFPYTTLFRSKSGPNCCVWRQCAVSWKTTINQTSYGVSGLVPTYRVLPSKNDSKTLSSSSVTTSALHPAQETSFLVSRSEEHTSELQSRGHLV